jgi:hypothetical protein
MTPDEYKRLRQQAEEKHKRAEEEHQADLAAIERVFQLSQKLTEAQDAKEIDIVPDDDGEVSVRRYLDNRPKSDDEYVDETDASSNGHAEPPGAKTLAKGELIAAVRTAINRVRVTWPSFTILTLVKDLLANGIAAKTPSVHNVLVKLVRDGVLEVARQGSGRRPTLYRSKKTQQGQQSTS